MAGFEQYTEPELIRRIVSGEKALYEIIVRRFNPYLYKIGRSYNLSHEETQDQMQETFIDAYKNLQKFEGRSEIRTWIIRIMMNNCYRRKNKSAFKNEVMQEVNDSATPMFNSGTGDSRQSIQNRELGQVIEAALGRIPFDYRMAFSLREINGLNVSETAGLLNISESNVKVRVNRAKAMLRTEIEKAYSSEDLFEFNLVYCNAMVDNVMNRINEL